MKMNYNILLVDDDVHQAAVVERLIQRNKSLKTQFVDSGVKAMELLASPEQGKFDMILLDLVMPDMSGVEVLKRIRQINKHIPVIIRSGYDDAFIVKQAIKEGAADFVKKLDSAAKLEGAIVKALHKQSAKHTSHATDELIGRAPESHPQEMRQMRPLATVNFASIIGEHESVQDMIKLGKNASQLDVPVCIIGQHGSGKELLAHAIHAASKRCMRPFIAVNCGAMPTHVMESLLFGQEEANASGLAHKTVGKFREAEGGTLLLDNVTRLTAEIQEKLQQFMQDGMIQPRGAAEPVKVNVRLIVSTEQDLNQEVIKKQFREDLYYRLNMLLIEIPALGKRSSDIPLLTKAFIHEYAVSEKRNVVGISKEAQEMLNRFSWPGNIRQLRGVVYRAVVMAKDKILQLHDFPQIQYEMNHSAVALQADMEYASAFLQHSAMNMLALENASGHVKTLQEIEKETILNALKHYNHHMSNVAKHLNIGRSTLYRKLDEYGIKFNQNNQ